MSISEWIQEEEEEEEEEETIEIEDFLGERSISPIWEYEVYIYFPELCAMEVGINEGICYYA